MYARSVWRAKGRGSPCSEAASAPSFFSLVEARSSARKRGSPRSKSSSRSKLESDPAIWSRTAYPGGLTAWLRADDVLAGEVDEAGEEDDADDGEAGGETPPQAGAAEAEGEGEEDRE